MKPHEEEWARHPSKAGFWIVNGGGEGGILLTVNGSEAHGTLAAAAPDMARAILAMGEHVSGSTWHLTDCIGANLSTGCLPECEAAREALTKAGALP
jgi:hypothetical protein